MNPTQHLERLNRDHPGWAKQAELLMADRGRAGLSDWPEWCLLPMAGWQALTGEATPTMAGAREISRLSAVGAWRYCQGIYRFAPALQEALAATEPGGKLPAKVLLNLPEWCLYIECKGLWGDGYYSGAFVHLEHDAGDGRAELRLLLDTDHGLVPMPIHLGDWSVVEALERMAHVAQYHAEQAGAMIATIDYEVIAASLAPLLALITYLCSEGAEIAGEGYPYRGRPQWRKVKRGLAIVAPRGPRVWRVGEALGERLGAEREGPATHMRRAHWHHYWTGPRDGERKLICKWLHPILVNG